MYKANQAKSAFISQVDPVKSEFKELSVTISPNPAIDFTRLLIDQPVSDRAKVEVYDMLGRTLYSKMFEGLEKMNATMELPTNALNPGIYIVKVWHGEIEQSIKLEVQK